ncbi:MAG: bifunctional serine/threonine-protein kinase/formylglycine-generating enzyme family protein [Gemmataceae bacterium]|nr:bifunctional serine/threonine-protein kinase/formylglycine-generating enzyme family protein [Gemmataceae bacterium]
MSSTTLDGNLVLAGLAVQHGMISRPALERALATWSEHKNRPLGRILVEQGALREDDLYKLEGLVRKQMEANGGDISRTLMSLDCYGTLREVARSVADAELHETLCRTAPPARPSGEPGPTMPPTSPPAAPSGPQEPGELRYRVLRSHARGGLGEVFVAQDRELNREVAFKQIQARYADDEPSRARFLLEGEVTGCLEHPGIVPVYGLGYDADGNPYYAMRFVRGQSLKEAINAYHQPGKTADEGARALQFRKLLEQFVAVCNAIGYAHSRGVLHRDIKPDNVMLGQYGETLVVDWGIAKVLGATEVTPTRKEQPLRPLSGVAVTETLPGEVIGTPAYMSPEQAAGELEALGPESDVYSLGATLYQLASGQTAFRDTNVLVVLGKIQRGVFPPPRQVNRQVPRALNAICLKAMALRPQDRYRSAKELAEDVERWLADEPVRAYREPLFARLTRWVRRHKALVTGAAALLVTAVVALAVSTVLIGDALLNEEKARKEEKVARLAAEKAKRAAEQAQEIAEGALTKEAIARKQQEQARLKEEAARLREVEERKRRALAQVGALLTANPRAVPSLIEALKTTSADVLPRLRELWAEGDAPGRRARLTRVGLALLVLDNDESVKAKLFPWMIEAAEPLEMLLLRDALLPYREELKAALWQRVDSARTAPEERFRAMVALAAFDQDNARWQKAGRPVAEQLLSANPLHLGTWMEALRPVSQKLLGPLAESFRGQGGSERRLVAAEVLANYAAKEVGLLTQLALDADPGQWAVLLPRLQDNQTASAALLDKELRKTPPPPERVAERDELARRQAQAAVGLYQLGRPDDAWPLLRQTTDPSRRTYLIHDLGRLNSSPGPLLRRLEKGQALDPSERRALILALGEYSATQLPTEERGKLVPLLVRWYRDDPDAGVHAAIDWLLRPGKRGPEARKLDWGQARALANIDSELAGQAPGKRDWYVTRKEGHTLTVIRKPAEFVMGSPAYEPGREDWEIAHRKRIPRSFAIASKEVTVAQYRRFLEARPEFKAKELEGKTASPDQDGPQTLVTYLEAAAYCNWLSAQDGIPEDQWCYEINPKTETVRFAKDFLKRTGYRLPTEAEWEYACRAGTVTSRFYGSSESLLGEYAWHLQTSDDRAWPVGQLKPNDLGLFDMYGNVWEWCHERNVRYPQAPGDTVYEDNPDLKLETGGQRAIRGGSFISPGKYSRSATRSNSRQTLRFVAQGFRVARTYP